MIRTILVYPHAIIGKAPEGARLVRSRIIGARRASIKGAPWFHVVTHRVVGAICTTGYEPSLRIYQVTHVPSGRMPGSCWELSRANALSLARRNIKRRGRPYVLGAIARDKVGVLHLGRRAPAKFKFRSL